MFVVVVPFLPLLISWRWDWWEAWVYAVICVLGFAISRALAARRHPDLLAERARFLQHEDAKPWDKILAPLVGLGGGLIPLVAGLDALLDWSPTFSLPLKILALIVLLAGYALGSYALIEDRFFSGMVRIQTERGHQVVSTGPYRWVRHPGYAGALWSYLAMPLFLDSGWALLPALFLTTVPTHRAARAKDHMHPTSLRSWVCAPKVGPRTGLRWGHACTARRVMQSAGLLPKTQSGLAAR